ncbi:cell division control protein 14 [Perkinsus chesapeaki]|uniref:Cell division control protein 14 n=1 Tax=Perkinsus chesapeaki TaxID=330153 RepID=A0A7J6LTU5_PERCH|nr:cell division control protein 14 [Perkinsus chesapeaki]
MSSDNDSLNNEDRPQVVWLVPEKFCWIANVPTTCKSCVDGGGSSCHSEPLKSIKRMHRHQSPGSVQLTSDAKEFIEANVGSETELYCVENDSALNCAIYVHQGVASNRHFGPMSFWQVSRFCDSLESELATAAESSKVLVMVTSPFAATASNAATMLMCYLVLRKGFSCEETQEKFSSVDIADFPNPFVFTSTPKAASLRPIDCARGLQIAKQMGWYPDVGQWRALRLKYSATWVVPGLFLAMPDPVTIDDGFSRTSLISKSDIDSDVMSEAQQQQPTTPTSLPKAEEASEVGLVDKLQELKVGMILRINKMLERNDETRWYDPDAILPESIGHTDIPMGDGGLPSAQILTTAYKAMTETLEKRPDAAIALHCHAGLGRTLVLIAHAIVHALGWPDGEYGALHGWLRIVRPGSLTSIQQAEFVRNGCELRGGSKELDDAVEGFRKALSGRFKTKQAKPTPSPKRKTYSTDEIQPPESKIRALAVPPAKRSCLLASATAAAAETAGSNVRVTRSSKPVEDIPKVVLETPKKEAEQQQPVAAAKEAPEPVKAETTATSVPVAEPTSAVKTTAVESSPVATTAAPTPVPKPAPMVEEEVPAVKVAEPAVVEEPVASTVAKEPVPAAAAVVEEDAPKVMETTTVTAHIVDEVKPIEEATTKPAPEPAAVIAEEAKPAEAAPKEKPVEAEKETKSVEAAAPVEEAMPAPAVETSEKPTEKTEVKLEIEKDAVKEEQSNATAASSQPEQKERLMEALVQNIQRKQAEQQIRQLLYSQVQTQQQAMEKENKPTKSGKKHNHHKAAEVSPDRSATATVGQSTKKSKQSQKERRARQKAAKAAKRVL